MDSLDTDDFEHQRDVELSSLTAIYPEIQRIHQDDPYTITLDVPVNPSKPVAVFFPATPDNISADPAQGNRANVANGAAVVGQPDSHEVTHLPSVRLEMVFGPQYPAEQPPTITISANPPWLPAETVKRLEDDGPRLWEEMGRDMVGFTYIDHVQQSAEHVFGLVDEKGSLEIDPQHKIAVLDYDIRAKRAAFEKGTFNCGVCLGT
jgi:E3 ubiquitin-protein ligase RNF14